MIIIKKKGYSTIHFVIFLLIFVFAISFLIDVSIISWKYRSLSNIADFVNFTLSNQSGVRQNVPNGFPHKYLTSSMLYNQIDEIMKANGVEDWEVRINNTKLTTSSNINLTEGQQFDVELRAKYKWRFSLNFLNLPEQTISIKRKGYASYKLRDQNIKFEKKL